MGNPVKAEGPRTFSSPSSSGEHTEEILRGLLDYAPGRSGFDEEDHHPA
jgi:hypothetical protein